MTKYRVTLKEGRPKGFFGALVRTSSGGVGPIDSHGDNWFVSKGKGECDMLCRALCSYGYSSEDFVVVEEAAAS